MNQLICSGVLTEKSYGDNFIYILQNSNDFLITEYKVLQSQKEIRFVPCLKFMYNGNFALYYHIDRKRTLLDFLPSMDGGSFLYIVSNLLNSVLEIKNNGFLTCSNVDISLDKIFVNASNSTVGLIYTPLRQHVYADYSEFERELRTELIDVIHQYNNLQSPAVSSLEHNLLDHSMQLHTIAAYIHNGNRKDKVEVSNIQTFQRQQMSIISMSPSMQMKLIVDKDEYIIGKKAGSVDGVISFNSAISRVHCKITQNEYGFKVEDLGSANGTYINQQKLTPYKPLPIKNGDIIRLANSDFRIVIQ